MNFSSYNCQTCFLILLIIVVLFILSKSFNIFEHFTKDNKTYNIGVCSKNCCSTQWPTPINATEKSKVDPKLVGKGLYTSNLTCNNGVINTGCVCLNEQSKKVLGNRGFVEKLPSANGLLDKDYKISAFKIMEDTVPRPMNVLGQTTELTGTKKDISLDTGISENKFDSKLEKLKTVQSDIDLVKNFSLPVNNNIITYDNKAINDALIDTNISGNELTSSPVSNLLTFPIGIDTKDMKARN